MITVHIPGNPVSKGRPRFVRATGRAYTPKPTVEWEDMAAAILRNARNTCWDSEGAVGVIIRAVKKRPQRLVKAEPQLGELWRTTKPDADNVAKCVCDALQKSGVIKDDSQVVRLEVHSLYGPANRRDGWVDVRVRWLGESERPPAGW